MQFKDFLSESFKKEYGYRVKIAADCGSEQMDALEACLQKYNLVSATPWKRTPIQENPVEFVRMKGVKCTSEVCSSDVILKYPTNPRLLEVWLAVNMGLTHDQVLVYDVKEPRRLEADMAAERVEADLDRSVTEEDAVLAQEDQAHYEAQNADTDQTGSLFGEDYNKKFLDELAKIKKEKGADYFRSYPTKDELMGDNLRSMYDDLVNGSNMARGTETKEVTTINQHSAGKA
jgi:hypothetical protein